MTPEEAYDKAISSGERQPELEEIIKTNPYNTLLYSKHIIKGRWQEAEGVIVTDPRSAYHYAKDVIGGKLPEDMHKAMLLHSFESNRNDSGLSRSSKDYLKEYFEFIKPATSCGFLMTKEEAYKQQTMTMTKEAEEAYEAYEKAISSGKRTPGLEEIIKKDPEYAYYYANYIIKDRWKEAEDVIKKDSYHAYLYSRDVIKDRWKEAEDAIKEEPSYAYFYSRNIIKDRWKEAEDVIATDPEYAYCYARDIIRGKLPEVMHKAMLLHSFETNFYVKEYFKFTKNI